MTVQEKTMLEAELTKLKEMKDNVKGSVCEVYSRVCGYLRPTQNWNKGKKEEFTMRTFYTVK